MRPLDRLSEYLGVVERRLRLLAITRGIAATAAAALIFTVVAVLLANYYAFSNPSVLSARLLLFFGIAFAIAAALVVPVIRLNRRRAAREAENKYPQFEERLLTFTERVEQNANDPFLHLLADDALSVAQQAEPKEVAKTSWLFSFSSAAAVAAAILLWLGLSGPGFLGYGTSLLWGGLPKGDMKPFYDIEVQPGNHTVKKRGTEIITARLHGFTAPKVRFFGKYASSSQWEPVEMRTQPDGTAYEFVIPGLLESMDYYVEAGGVKSKGYKLTVIDLPSVKNMTTTYHFPAWTGMKDATEKGGDLRAVEGTVADVEIQTDKPLSTGALLLDDGSKLPLRSGPNGTLMAKVPIQKDGQYHVVATENGEDVRLTEEFFIEAQKDRAPEVKITRPGRDFRASPIEEVTVTAEATDDFGLKAVELHYSVNGGAEKTASVLQSPGSKNSTGSMTIPLEDFKVVPGDIVSLYATAKDARNSTNTDIFFVEVQPFERNYSQSQQGGGGGGGGGGQDDQNEISQRQKEIITATFNQLKGNGAKASDSENANFLSQVQSKLRDQAKSLADRMKSRQLSDAGDSFKEFVNNMEQAVSNMGPAADKLKGANWKDALGPEEKALQYLERAEALRRDIQVAFGSRGGGGGGGAQGGARDLEGLFDLELDTEKNQFESAQQMQQSGDQRQQEIDDALQKLEQLARRQQELANQKNNPQQLSEKRYQQEMLRREAEQLQRQLDQMTKNMQNSQGQSSQSQQSQNGQPGQSGQQQGQQSNGRSGQQGRSGSADSQQLNQTVDRIRQALDNMRQAASSQQSGTPQSEADARRAAEQLKEAEQLLSGLRNQQSGNKVDDLARQADNIAQQQQAFEGQLRRSMSNQGQGQPQGRFSQSSINPQQAQQLTDDRRKEVEDLKRLEAQMQSAVRDLAATQPKASGKLREALGEMQQQELPRDMERNLEYIRRGYAEYAALSEPQITAGINNLRDQLKGVQQTLADNKDGKGQGAGDKDNKAVEQALDQVEKLRRQLEQMQQRQAQNGQNGQNGQQRGGGQQPGQNNSQNAQNGQGGNQPGQNGNQGGGGNQGGYQPGNLSRNGGPNGGAGYRNGGSNYGYYGGLGYNNPNPGLPYEGVRPGDFENQYRETLNTLQAVEGQIQNDPKAAKDLQDLVREMQRLNPWSYANDPELNARIQADMTAQIETVELELRRKVDDATGGSVRSAGTGPVPQGYETAVPEYFKKLSKGNK